MILIAESPSRRTEYRRYLGNAGLSVVQHAREFFIALWPEDRIREATLHERQAATRLVVALIDAMADDACDAFA